MTLVLILLALIAFIVLSTTRLKLHPFLALLAAALIAGFAYQVPTAEIVKTVTGGFGSILGYIGIVIVLGTIIGVILERSGAAITMAESVIRLLGERFPTLTMSIIGYLVSIPVFCDSGFVILNSLKNALAARMKISTIAMSVALATGLYATHTFVPPTPGPIAAAGNLGLDASLGLVIVVGLVVAFVTAMAGMWWANRFVGKDIPLVDDGQVVQTEEDFSELRARYGKLPSATQAFAPIFVPILLICLGSVAVFPSKPLGEGVLFACLNFLGQPVIALLVGLALACTLLKGQSKREEFHERVVEGIQSAAPILLITGAGGAFGAMLKITPLGDYLGSMDLLAGRVAGVTGIPGHGPDVEDTGRAAQVLGQHRRDRLEQIIAARAELGRDADATAITQHIYRDVTPFLLKVAEQSTKVALRYLDRLDSDAGA